MNKSGLFVSALIIGGIFLVVWRLRGDSDAATEISPDTAATTSGRVISDREPSAPSGIAGEAENMLRQGEAALQRGDQEAAMQTLSNLVRRFPTQPAGVRAAVKLADIHEKAGDLYQARNMLSEALAGLDEGSDRQEAVQRLHRINGELVFSRRETPESITYVVRSGDNLTRIARQFDITPEFIKRINYLTSDRIHPGDRLKVLQGPFDVFIEKSKFRLIVRRAGIFIKEYPVGLGKDGSTPEGEFIVTNKLIDPEWNPPGPEYAAPDDPDNPLGTRWIGFKPHYGIHGTVEPEMIGVEDSRGCVRLFNEDVEELFDLVVRGSQVVITP